MFDLLSIELDTELQFLNELSMDNAKCYQLWYLLINFRQHRQFVIAKSELPIDIEQMEMNNVANILDDDDKNFHAWSYRQWLVKFLFEEKSDGDIWRREFVLVNEFLVKDVRNNSAWSQRYYILTQAPFLFEQEEELEYF